MNINLDNYEQWLLLYVDNELSAAECNAVEEFLRQYPYLRQELEALMQATLTAEPISFTAKTSLLKPLISEYNEEKMLLQLDAELGAPETAKLEKHIEANKNLQKAWAALQKTKLNAADIIPFPDKQLLYKKERARIILIPFIRWTAAAAVIGIGLFLAITLNKVNTGGNESIVKTNS